MYWATEPNDALFYLVWPPAECVCDLVLFILNKLEFNFGTQVMECYWVRDRLSATAGAGPAIICIFGGIARCYDFLWIIRECYILVMSLLSLARVIVKSINFSHITSLLWNMKKNSAKTFVIVGIRRKLWNSKSLILSYMVGLSVVSRSRIMLILVST